MYFFKVSLPLHSGFDESLNSEEKKHPKNDSWKGPNMWPHVLKVYTTAFPSLKCEAALLCLSLLFLFYSLSFHLPRASSVNLEFLLLFFLVRRLWGLALFPLLPSHMLSYLTTQPASHLPLHRRTPHRGAKAGGIENPRLLLGNFMGVRVPPPTRFDPIQ